jgi:hypothetical protein
MFQSTRPCGRELPYANTIMRSNLAVLLRGSIAKREEQTAPAAARDSEVFELKAFIGIADLAIETRPLEVRGLN